MPRLELTAGPIDYVDTGGDGPVLVFGHGLAMNESQWRKVLPLLPDDYRCILPTLPIGGHRHPMHPDADLSLRGQAAILAEFFERLGLQDVTLVLNDWGGGQILLSEHKAERLGRLVLVACEAFDNYPPGSVKFLTPLAKIPFGMWLFMRLLGIKAIRQGQGGYGGMSKMGVPDEVMLDWFAPATNNRLIRRDLAKYVAAKPADRVLLEWSDRMRSFDRPVLVVWATEDKLMPREHGPRLAELFPQGRLVEIENSATLVPEDQPDQLAGLLIEFVSEADIDQAPNRRSL